MIDSRAFAIWNHLQDELSKDIFLERIHYSFCGGFSGGDGDIDWVGLLRRSAPAASPEFEEVLAEVERGSFAGKELWVFGAGNAAKTFLQQLQKRGALEKASLCGFIDNFKKGLFLGKPICTFDALRARGADCVIVVASFTPTVIEQLLEQIRASGFSGKVYRLIGRTGVASEQYFDMAHSEKEIFVDAGSFDGATALGFVKWCANRYEKIYAFEACQKNYQKVVEALAGVENCEISSCALSDFNGDAVMQLAPRNVTAHTIDRVENSANASVNYQDRETVKCVKLDDFLGGRPVTFVKMDIEGAEAAALRGAEKTIRACKPKLAISLYHKPEDILELPLLILAYNPDYKLRLRHYSNMAAETCLYAE